MKEIISILIILCIFIIRVLIIYVDCAYLAYSIEYAVGYGAVKERTESPVGSVRRWLLFSDSLVDILNAILLDGKAASA